MSSLPAQPGGPDCEGLIHRVTTERLPEQRPFPPGTHTIELSWSRTRGVMRLRVTQCEHEGCRGEEYEWYLKEFVGKWGKVRGDPESGRMLFEAKCRIWYNDGHPRGQFWRGDLSRGSDDSVSNRG